MRRSFLGFIYIDRRKTRRDHWTWPCRFLGCRRTDGKKACNNLCLDISIWFISCGPAPCTRFFALKGDYSFHPLHRLHPYSHHLQLCCPLSRLIATLVPHNIANHTDRDGGGLLGTVSDSRRDTVAVLFVCSRTRHGLTAHARRTTVRSAETAHTPARCSRRRRLELCQLHRRCRGGPDPRQEWRCEFHAIVLLVALLSFRPFSKARRARF